MLSQHVISTDTMMSNIEHQLRKEISDYQTRLEIKCQVNVNKTSMALASKRLLDVQSKNNRTVLSLEFITNNKVC